jgi:hypothetical protein
MSGTQAVGGCSALHAHAATCSLMLMTGGKGWELVAGVRQATTCGYSCCLEVLTGCMGHGDWPFTNSSVAINMLAGRPLSTVDNCSWSLTLQPIYGWGDTSARSQKATAGWLSVLSVFEPHWQVIGC